MKSVFYDKDKAEEEKKETKKVSAEEQTRLDYFQRLSKDRKFKKYIIEGILDKEIQLNKDLSGSIESMIKATPEEVKSILIAKGSALKTSQNIKNSITINF
jgi:DNA-directed RNA polymerase subunit F